jgi:hypothetical protein
MCGHCGCQDNPAFRAVKAPAFPQAVTVRVETLELKIARLESRVRDLEGLCARLTSAISGVTEACAASCADNARVTARLEEKLMRIRGEE